MSGDTLSTLVEECQYELTQVVTPAAGQNFREHVKSRLRREYRRLYLDHDWRHLRRWVDVPMVAGERYYDYPADAGLENVMDVHVKWGTVFNPVTDDLTIMDFNAHNSDAGVRTDPVQKWRPYSAEQFEVWPVPASSSAFLRFTVRKPFVQMVDESDRCELDTDLVVLFAAARLANRINKDEAQRLFVEAEQHYNSLKNRGRFKAKVNLADHHESGYLRGFANKIIVGVNTR